MGSALQMKSLMKAQLMKTHGKTGGRLLVSLAAALLFISCNDGAAPATGTPPPAGNPGSSGSGPLNGSWVLESASCDGRNVPVGEMNAAFRFADQNADVTVTDASGCAVTLHALASYPSSGLARIANQSYSCSPGSCSSICSDPVDSTPEDVHYALSGTELRLTTQAGDADELCGMGQSKVLTLRRS
jgi:hypothetical protein